MKLTRQPGRDPRRLGRCALRRASVDIHPVCLLRAPCQPWASRPGLPPWISEGDWWTPNNLLTGLPPQPPRGLMMPLTPRAEAVMMLTVPFGKGHAKGHAGRGAGPLTPTEWAEFARWLDEMKLRPESLLDGDPGSVLARWAESRRGTRARIEGDHRASGIVTGARDGARASPRALGSAPASGR